MDSDDDDAQWTIHDLDHAPAPRRQGSARDLGKSPVNPRRRRSTGTADDPFTPMSTRQGRRRIPGTLSGNILPSLPQTPTLRAPPERGHSFTPAPRTFPPTPSPINERRGSLPLTLDRKLAALNAGLGSGSGSGPMSPPSFATPTNDRRSYLHHAVGMSDRFDLRGASSDQFANETASSWKNLRSPQGSEQAGGYGSSDDFPLSPSEASKRRRSDSASGSGNSVSSVNIYDDDEDDDDQDGPNNSGRPNPVIFMGFQLPEWFSKRPSWNRVASFIVTRAPCFWFAGNRHPTDRTILFRLNILCAFLAVFQIISFFWLTFMFIAPKADEKLDTQSLAERENSGNYISDAAFLSNTWNINGFVIVLGCMATIILCAVVLTVRVIRNVNLVGAIRYLWFLLWVIPVEIFLVIALFDYFQVTDVWIVHAWRAPYLAGFRKWFCSPSSSANTLCTVPIGVNETFWCLRNYNSTQCKSIRDSAQKDMETTMITYYYFNAAVGLALLCLLVLSVITLQGIISRPLVQKSRESNVAAWLSLPSVGCFLSGMIYAFSESSVISVRSDTDTDAKWIGPLYLATCFFFSSAALLAWYISVFSIMSTRDKHQKLLAIMLFIGADIVVIVLLVVIFAASVAFSITLYKFSFSNDDRGRIACFIDRFGSCSRCEEEENQCPEWSTKDVTRVLQTQVKNGASIAAIFLIYAFSALRFGFGLRKHVRMYQIEYV